MIVKRKQKNFGFFNVMGALGKNGNFANAFGKSGMSIAKRAGEAAKGIGKVGVAAAVPVGLTAAAIPTIAATGSNGLEGY